MWPWPLTFQLQNQTICRICPGHFLMGKFANFNNCPIAHHVSYQNTNVSCCLDYCNSLLYGIPATTSSRTCSLSRTLSRVTLPELADVYTFVLCKLHWLLVRQYVEFKVTYVMHSSFWSGTWVSHCNHLTNLQQWLMPAPFATHITGNTFHNRGFCITRLSEQASWLFKKFGVWTLAADNLNSS